MGRRGPGAPVVADFHPASRSAPKEGRRRVAFLGCTIGNLLGRGRQGFLAIAGASAAGGCCSGWTS